MNDTAAENAKEKLIADFKAVVADSEALLNATVSPMSEKASELRDKLMQRLADAKTRLITAEALLVDKTKAAAKATDEYVHDNPWQSVIIAGGIGFIIGFLSRRD